MNQDEQKRIIERFIDAYNGFDVDGMFAFMHPNCFLQDVSGQENTLA
jgi:hypothetical protein